MASATRRDVLSYATTAVVCGLVPKSLRALSGTYRPSLASIPPNRTVFQVKDSRRRFLLQTYFPGLMENPDFAPLLPFAVVIRNGGKTKVRGYRFKWTAVTSDSSHLNYSRFFISRPTADAVTHPGTGVYSLLRPKEFAVVTPFSFWSQRAYHKRLRNSQPLKAQMKDPAAVSFVQACGHYKSLVVSRAGKICRKAAIGSNLTDDVAYYEACRSAEGDVARNILVAIHENPDVRPADISNMLLTDTTPIPSTVVNRDLYQTAKAKYTEVVITGLNAHGIEPMLSRISQVAHRPTRRMAVRLRTHVPTGVKS